jgi:Ca2+-binding EF-hand superfamily protein
LFDYDKDGKISAEDLLINLKLLVGTDSSEDQLKDITDRTIQEFSKDGKYITFEEFEKIFDM